MEIKFDENYNNKLDCKYFTTIRDFSKFDKYVEMENRKVKILLNGKEYCKAKVISVRCWNFDRLPAMLKLLDTGITNYDKIFNKFIKSSNVVVIMCERL